MRRVGFGGRVIAAGVTLKAILMGTLVSILAVAPFVDSLILVLVSACATGVFGIIIVLVQTHAEKELHRRMDKLEHNTTTAARAATAAAEGVAGESPAVPGLPTFGELELDDEGHL